MALCERELGHYKAALDHENRIYDRFAETWFYLAQANLALRSQRPRQSPAPLP